MLRGIGKLTLCVALLLALGSLVSQSAWAACGCSRCAKKSSCGCGQRACGCKKKCHKGCGCSKCGGGCGLPQFCGDQGSGGYRLDLTCADACCIEPPCDTEVCVEGWDLCQKWCDGLVHHPYELVYNGHGNLCDFGSCEAFIPCKRHGVMCHTECKDDACGCGQCAETVCTDITRPRTIPWWFNPGHGNTYLDESGNPICGQTLPPKEVPPPATPPVVQPPVVPPTPPQPPTPPATTAPPEEETTPVVIDGRG